MSTERIKLVSAMVLGDGCLRTWKNCHNYAYSFGQIATHKDYVDWQANVVDGLSKVTVRYYDKRTSNDGVNHQAHYKLETGVHPFYTLLHSRTYNGRVKSISLHDLKLFDWQSAAIWYMDDGYRLKSQFQTHDGNVFLCTDNYSHAEVILLQKLLYEKLNIPFDVSPRGKSKSGTKMFRLKTRKDNALRFTEGVEPYILPSFRYKLYSKQDTPIEE
jgi:hypothetical protein